MRLLIAGLVMLASTGPIKAACTQVESEDKIIEIIYVLKDTLPRNQEKAASAAKKFEQALVDARKPAPTPQASQATIDKLCEDIDGILAELRR
jgi:hypothetical protein